MTQPAEPSLLAADPRLLESLRALSKLRLVFFTGLPATGKSLLAHQLAHLAYADGRRVYLLQWDVCRPPLEAHEAARPYPTVDGVTHVVIRRAIGLWAREAVARWSIEHADPASMLIGETPFVGWRLVELAQSKDDAAEAVLASPACRFVLTLPSGAVQAHVTAERARRAAMPRHALEREDAPPHLLRASWLDVLDAARDLGVPWAVETYPSQTYNSTVYRAVYEHLLRHRSCEIVPIDTVLPTEAMSVYELDVPHEALIPTPDEAERYVGEAALDIAEGRFDAARWWRF